MSEVHWNISSVGMFRWCNSMSFFGGVSSSFVERQSCYNFLSNVKHKWMLNGIYQKIFLVWNGNSCSITFLSISFTLILFGLKWKLLSNHFLIILFCPYTIATSLLTQCNWRSVCSLLKLDFVYFAAPSDYNGIMSRIYTISTSLLTLWLAIYMFCCASMWIRRQVICRVDINAVYGTVQYVGQIIEFKPQCPDSSQMDKTTISCWCLWFRHAMPVSACTK